MALFCTIAPACSDTVRHFSQCPYGRTTNAEGQIGFVSHHVSSVGWVPCLRSRKHALPMRLSAPRKLAVFCTTGRPRPRQLALFGATALPLQTDRFRQLALFRIIGRTGARGPFAAPPADEISRFKFHHAWIIRVSNLSRISGTTPGNRHPPEAELSRSGFRIHSPVLRTGSAGLSQFPIQLCQYHTSDMILCQMKSRQCTRFPLASDRRS